MPSTDSTVAEPKCAVGVTARSLTIPTRFAEQVALHADRPALLRDATGEMRTYRELDRIVRVLAARILDHLPESASRSAEAAPVALLMEHDAAIVIAILAALHTGRPYQALDAERSERYLQEMLARGGAPLVLADAAHLDRARSLGREVCEVDLAALEMEPPMTEPRLAKALAELEARSPASIIMTSGSTGSPKRNTQTHGNLVGYVDFYRDVAGIVPDDRFSLVTRTSFFASTSAIFGSLLSGASLLPLDIRALGLVGAWRSLLRHRVSVFHSVPTVFRRLMIAGEAGGSSEHLLPAMRIVRLGGEPVRARDWRLTSRLNPDCRLMVVLSASETGPLAYDLYGMDSPPVCGPTAGNGDLLLPLRRRVPGVDLSIVRDEAWADDPGLSRWTEHRNGNTDTGAGPIGRLLVTSAALSVETAESDDVLDRLVDERGRTTWLSGDVARIDAGGAVHLLGRSDNRVKIAGAFVSLAEVEAAMCDLPELGIREAAVRALPPAEGANEMRLAAWYVPENPVDPPQPAHIRRGLGSVLPPHMIPALLIEQDALPTTATGKIDRQRLVVPPTAEPSMQPPDPTSDVETSAGAAGGAPIDDTLHRGLAELWSRALRLDPREARTSLNFFDNGGSSIAALDLLLGIERRYGVVLPIAALIEAPTPAQMAEVIASSALTGANADLVTLRASDITTGSDGEAAPLFCIHPRDGWVFAFRDLAEQLPGTFPIYALQSPGLRGRLRPLRSIESLAAHYIAIAETVQPTGPCRLCGYCIGGVVAAEMARQLRRRGRDVTALVLIDARIPQPRTGWTGLRERWLSWLRGPLLEAQVLKRRTAAQRQRFLFSARYRHKIKKIHSAALHQYRPQPLDIKPLTLLSTVDSPANAARARALAQALHRASEVATIPGEHNTCLLPPHIHATAPLIAGWLNTGHART